MVVVVVVVAMAVARYGHFLARTRGLGIQEKHAQGSLHES